MKELLFAFVIALYIGFVLFLFWALGANYGASPDRCERGVITRESFISDNLWYCNDPRFFNTEDANSAKMLRPLN